jgi:beta-glucosidase-like glycosyl hydrolase
MKKILIMMQLLVGLLARRRLWLFRAVFAFLFMNTVIVADGTPYADALSYGAQGRSLDSFGSDGHMFSPAVPGIARGDDGISKDWAETTLASLTTEQKIAQMCVVSVDANDSTSVSKAKSVIKNNGVSGVILDFDDTKILMTPSDKKAMIDAFNALSTTIPLFIIQDMELSLLKQLETSNSGGISGLDAIPDHRLIGILGEAVGNYMKSLGVNMLLSPVITVDANVRNKLMGGTGTINPRELACRGFTFVSGLRKAGMFAIGKHFPSSGSNTVDPHIALPVMYYDKDVLNNGEVSLFKELFKTGVDGVMLSHVYIPAYDASMSKPASLLSTIVTDLLQKTLEFQGLIVVDQLEIQTKTLKYSSADFIIEAFNAGNDLVLGVDDVPNAIKSLAAAVKLNSTMLNELNRRVLKILKMKDLIKQQTSGIKIDLNIAGLNLGLSLG